MTTTVTESNLVRIPAEIAREFDIHPGTKLQWSRAPDGSIAIKPLAARGELARQLLGAGRHLLATDPDPIGSLIRQREADDPS